MPDRPATSPPGEAQLSRARLSRLTARERAARRALDPRSARAFAAAGRPVG